VKETALFGSFCFQNLHFASLGLECLAFCTSAEATGGTEGVKWVLSRSFHGKFRTCPTSDYFNLNKVKFSVKIGQFCDLNFDGMIFSKET